MGTDNPADASVTLAEAGDLELADENLAHLRTFLVLARPEGMEVQTIGEGEVVTFGRAPEATVIVDHSTVSRIHSRVRCETGGLVVEDCGSRNGTKINGSRIHNETRRVFPGDTIRVGPLEIIVAQSATPKATLARSTSKAGAVDTPEGIVVADPAMQHVFQVARRLAPAPTTVLILGETGVGKEVVAEQIHRWSPRRDHPFVRLNCASLPETLLERELFGHERGSFTGAEQQKIGYFEAADKGTLFLDELGEISPAMQAKLLRALESRRIMRIGGTQEIAVDVRVLCATNRNLQADVKAGRFREDLYYRINAFTLEIPPLRDRPAEIALLADLFARRFARQLFSRESTIQRDAAEALERHSWPGNIRELRNAIEHAVVLAEGGPIRAEHLPANVLAEPEITGSPPIQGELRDRLSEMEKKSIETALEIEGGNQTRAAKRLGISRRALIYKLEKYGLKPQPR
jgi:two-component system, NtrC family, response regulator AtoC